MHRPNRPLESMENQSAQIADSNQPSEGALPNVTQRYTLAGAPNEQMSQSGTFAEPPVKTNDTLIELTDQQKAAIELIVQGKPDRTVAKSIEVHPKSVTRWRLYHAGFRAELSRRRNEVWGAAGDRFRGLLDKALDAFAKDLNNIYEPTRHRAARALLSLSQKFIPSPEEPVDPMEVIVQHARRIKRSVRSTDPLVEPVEADELEMAREDLARKLQENAVEGD